MKEIKEIIKPDHTFELFYFKFFGGTMERDFLSKLKNNYKGQKKFLSKLGFKELLNDDELIFDISREGNHTNYKSYFDNGRLKFEYTSDKDEDYKIDKSTETFELFYKDCQPKFRFSYEKDEIHGDTIDYQAFYNNGQLYRRCFFKNDLLEGIFEEYYIFGELNIKRNYVNGKNQENSQLIGFE